MTELSKSKNLEADLAEKEVKMKQDWEECEVYWKWKTTASKTEADARDEQFKKSCSSANECLD